VSRAFGGPAKLEQLKALKSSYERRDFVMKAGWATIPTAKEPNRDVAEGCAEVIAKAVGPRERPPDSGFPLTGEASASRALFPLGRPSTSNKRNRKQFLNSTLHREKFPCYLRHMFYRRDTLFCTMRLSPITNS
jgi:hypothetical protein